MIPIKNGISISNGYGAFLNHVYGYELLFLKVRGKIS